MTTGILKSFRYKNTLFLKCKSNPNLKNEYKICRNRLTNVIREAKCNYHEQVLFNLKNKCAKLWAHLKSFINPTVSNDIPFNANDLNNFLQIFLSKLLSTIKITLILYHIYSDCEVQYVFGTCL